jgi:ribonuclease P protein component
MERLLRRQDFLAAAKAPSCSTPSFIMRARNRADGKATRVGFTCTKTLGNAVVRNRIRRRLKEAARLTMPGLAKPAYDYVLIGRTQALTRDFEALRKDIISALSKLHVKDNRTLPS